MQDVFPLRNVQSQRRQSHEAGYPWWSTASEARQTCHRLDSIAQEAAAEVVSLHPRVRAVPEEDPRAPGRRSIPTEVQTPHPPNSAATLTRSNRPRHTQGLLNDMLSKSYRQKRPRNRSCMGERLAYLRSIRDGNRRMTPQPTPRLEVIKECAILLKSNPRGPRTNTQKQGRGPRPR